MRTPIHSMFLRRLATILAMVLLAFTPLVIRLAYLGIVRGRAYAKEASSRLVTRSWTPTVRGKILDRKGRVLAEDRPSYDIQVDYSVLSGAWISQQARPLARKLAGTSWSGMTKAQRDDLAARLEPVLGAHLDRGWERLAQTIGLSTSDVRARREAILAGVEARQLHVTQARRAELFQQHKALGEELTPSDLPRIERRVSEPISDTKAAHSIRGGVDDTVGFAAAALADTEVALALPGDLAASFDLAGEKEPQVPAMPGLTIIDTTQRDYPLDRMSITLPRDTLPTPLRTQIEAVIGVEGVACQILGRVRRTVYAEDTQRRALYLQRDPAARERATWLGTDLGAYRDGDMVGAAGVESACELTLRGLRGMVNLRRDSGAAEGLAAKPGADVSLTIDAHLQARVQAILSPEFGLATVQPWHGEDNTAPVGTPLAGAAVVLEIATGDILAAVSMPTFSRAQWDEAPGSIYEDRVGTPFVNRCWNKDYPPGSIVKPLILVSAVKAGVYDLAERIDCKGHYLPNQPNVLQCLLWKRYRVTHTEKLGHKLLGDDAIGQSCNYFFFELGRRLGPIGIQTAYREFGLGSRFDLQAGPEFAGHIGDIEGRAVSIGDATQMGIGQGPVAWTPLHAAAAFATLARRGEVIPPRLIRGGEPKPSADARLPKQAVSTAIEGIWKVVNDPESTGNHLTINGEREPIFNVPGVKVWGKTGTAQTPPLAIDPDGKEGPAQRAIAREGDHSWFVILAGKDAPTYAVAVIMEFGGGGGRVSGPICNQILHALAHEGYLEPRKD